MSAYQKDAVQLLQRKRFVICVLLTAILSYGFAAMNMTISVDDLHSDYYIGSGQTMLGAGRFTMTLLGALMNYSRNMIFNGTAIDLVSVALFAWAALNFCILMRRICGNAFTVNAATFFACFFISYPLIIEIWEYTGANLNVTFGYAAVSFALLLVHENLHGTRSWGRTLAACVLMMFVCAGYESLIIVYICGVFGVLFLQVIFGSQKEKTLAGILRQGICYAAVLLAGLLLQMAVHRLILIVGNIPAASNGARTISWFTRSPKEALLTAIAGNFEYLVLKGIIYFPITELLGACVVLLIAGICLCRKFGKVLLLPMFGMYGCLILLSFIQGGDPLYRTCQVFGFFVAFVAALLIMALEKLRYPRVKLLCLVLCGYLCFHQALYVNYFLTLNHQRSVAELNVVGEIGHDLQQGFDLSKPVVFVGTYRHTSEITEAASIPEDSLRWQIYQKAFLGCKPLSQVRFSEERLNRKLTESNIIYLIAFSIHAHTPTPMRELFSFQGYDIEPGSRDIYYDLGLNYVQENEVPAYPAPGYIRDAGDYIVVHLE